MSNLCKKYLFFFFNLQYFLFKKFRLQECMAVFLSEHYRLNPVIETAIFFPSE